jgi:hemoglobin-like flavoprotein
MFVGTDFQRQNKLLQHGIGLLFIYAKRANPAILDRIAGRHAHGELDIAPNMYPYFVDSLVGTVKLFDPQFNPALDEAWRAAVAPGIAFMASRHGKGPAAAS